jgi:hypothetical protein
MNAMNAIPAVHAMPFGPRLLDDGARKLWVTGQTLALLLAHQPLALLCGGVCPTTADARL